MRRGDVVWVGSGIGSSSLVWAVLGAWSRGAGVLLLDPDDDGALAVLRRVGVDASCLSPSDYERLVRLADRSAEQVPVVREVACTGGELPDALAAAVSSVLGSPIRNGYSLREAGVPLGVPAATQAPGGVVGRVLGTYLAEVLDDEGYPSKPGEEGNLAIAAANPAVFDGYWNAPELTQATFRGTWLITGDRATRDEAGWFMLARGATASREAHRPAADVEMRDALPPTEMAEPSSPPPREQRPTVLGPEPRLESRSPTLEPPTPTPAEEPEPAVSVEPGAAAETKEDHERVSDRDPEPDAPEPSSLVERLRAYGRTPTADDTDGSVE